MRVPSKLGLSKTKSTTSLGGREEGVAKPVPIKGLSCVQDETCFPMTRSATTCLDTSVAIANAWL